MTSVADLTGAELALWVGRALGCTITQGALYFMMYLAGRFPNDLGSQEPSGYDHDSFVTKNTHAASVGATWNQRSVHMPSLSS